jgi:predicted AAA+ superfamily ATPase
VIARIIKPFLQRLHKYFPVISVTGPWQSGKTTLIKAVFANLPYYNMENADQRNFVVNDPRAFLKKIRMEP